MADTTLWTFQDLVEQLCDGFDVEITERNRRLAREAVLTAYRDVPSRKRWTYYDRRITLQTEAQYATGTVTYDHTGGTYERQLTLVGGTWPTNAGLGRIILATIHYPIDERKSDTVVTLRPDYNPGADVAAGTAYTWYRSLYPLPVNFRRLAHMYDLDQERELRMTTDDVVHAGSLRYYQTPDTPWQGTIRNDGEYYNSLAVEFSPPPSTARTYDLMYEAAPRDLKIERYTTGTVTVTAGSSAVALTTGTWPVDCVGSILRLSASATAPTSVIGTRTVEGTGVDNRYFAQRVVVSRTSGSVVVMDAAASSDTTLTAVGYALSDPVDLEHFAMFTAFRKAAEAEFACAINHKTYERRLLVARQALREAMEADTRCPTALGTVVYDPWYRATITTD